MISKFLAALLWFTLAVGPGAQADVAVVNFSGNWIGTWTSSELGDSGSLEIKISQSGNSISGVLTAPGASDCGLPLVITLTGTITTNRITSTDNHFTDPCFAEQERISLTATRFGNTMNGSYTSDFFEDGSWNHADSGSLSLNRVCCTITASAGTGGGIVPSGTLEVAPGASMTFTTTADTGFTIADIVVDGISKGALKSYTFTNILANHAIAATFAESEKLLPFLPLLLDEN